LDRKENTVGATDDGAPLAVARGRVWKFGDNISTDLLVPGAAVLARGGSLSAEEAAQFCMAANRPGWATQVEPGDVIVAGRNFGCGSSRNGAAPLKTLGIAAVLAESIARIHLRNSINTGLITVICPGVSVAVEEGEHLSLDLQRGTVRIVESDRKLQAEQWPEDSPPMEILRSGGFMPFFQRRLREAGLVPDASPGVGVSR
jgi:3-isopropylmalate/(R)-2-methylmalate dehydratase small subunit